MRQMRGNPDPAEGRRPGRGPEPARRLRSADGAGLPLVQEVGGEGGDRGRRRYRRGRDATCAEGAWLMIQLKSTREIDLMAEGGRILAATVETLRKAFRPGISTADLDKIPYPFIRSHKAAVPAFKGPNGFPATTAPSIT